MKKAFLAGLLAFLPLTAQAQRWSLMGEANLLAGQYFYNNAAGSANGYVDLNLQQARSFSPESGFFINERYLYTGFKQVNELAGGGTLFQQSMDSSLGAKYIKRFEGGYSIKPRIGVRNQLFRETMDEDWGKGLYDYWRYEGGLTWERKTRLGLSVPWTYQISYDLYYTYYPRFKSLASAFGAALATPDPGERPLNTLTHQFSYRSEFDLPGFASAWGLASLSIIDFTDQKIVNSKGDYLDSKRSDVYATIGLGYSKRFSDFEALGRVRPGASMGLTLSSLMSNQNNFDTDPKRLQYVAGYYNYWEARLSPVASALFLKTQINVRLGYDFGYRSYSGRLTQNSGDGSYTGENLHQYTHGLTLEASYPLWRQLEFKARGLWAKSSSNNSFQQVYTYNYSSYNYFAGISWKL
ncbi:MAG: hypothetical protein HY922_05390 [Elusimicrobia bacterium]|nr:hypothetical protein [Elusimicrobiota bacterium]